ncbi:Uncharacterised protein [Klebsiella pneumoniae subsp. ozaenae]|uniref:Uncharacterized protein n=1 Tax=Klebsiella pneumoniae subsp. ozaenae TaxID=574 RepID=A0A377Z0A1_KLEPO|nr:Uncharacterised protein [Klebsiella pneumoniae subsp. ozaenae]
MLKKGEGILKKLMFLTIRDKNALDEYIKANRFRNVKDNMRFAGLLGYGTSKSAMCRYIKRLKAEYDENKF